MCMRFLPKKYADGVCLLGNTEDFKCITSEVNFVFSELFMYSMSFQQHHILLDSSNLEDA